MEVLRVCVITVECLGYLRSAGLRQRAGRQGLRNFPFSSSPFPSPTDRNPPPRFGKSSRGSWHTGAKKKPSRSEPIAVWARLSRLRPDSALQSCDEQRDLVPRPKRRERRRRGGRRL